MPNLAEILRNGSVDVVEVEDWRTRERAGTFTPVGEMNHHTAAGGTKDVPSLNVCINGRSGIPGPLCNILVGRLSAKAYLISDGRANDSGMGSSKVLRDVRRGVAPAGNAAALQLKDDTNGNSWFFDIEIENNGIGEDYLPAVMETVLRINVALALAYGWEGYACIAHREWTARKIDPAGIVMEAFRREIDRRIEALAAMSAGTGPSVDPIPVPVQTVPRYDPGGTVYDPPVTIPSPIVASLRAPNGGAWCLTKAGHVYGWDCPHHGQPAGQDYFTGRAAKKLEPHASGGYVVIATSGERYEYPAA